MICRVLLITGTVGVGKTSVLLEIGEALALADAPYAIVDLDWLAWLRPSPASGLTVRDVLEENLTRVAATFRTAGVERLVPARAVRGSGEVEAMRAAGRPCALTVACLTAQPAVIATRLGARDTGPQLAEHLTDAATVAAEAGSAGIGDVVVATDDRTVSSIARELLVGAGWAST